MMIALEGLCFYGFIFRSTFRASMFITVATKTNSITRHGTEQSTGSWRHASGSHVSLNLSLGGMLRSAQVRADLRRKSWSVPGFLG